MIIDFKDLLLKRYLDNEFDIPMVADVVEAGAVEINRIVETMLITSAAVKAAVDADLDPMAFKTENREAYKSGGMLFFTAADDVWEYRIAGMISQIAYEGSYQEGWIRYAGDAGPHPLIDVMRKKQGADHWQIWLDGNWIDNGPPVGFLDRVKETDINEGQE